MSLVIVFNKKNNIFINCTHLIKNAFLNIKINKIILIEEDNKKYLLYDTITNYKQFNKITLKFDVINNINNIINTSISAIIYSNNNKFLYHYTSAKIMYVHNTVYKYKIILQYINKMINNIFKTSEENTYLYNTTLSSYINIQIPTIKEIIKYINSITIKLNNIKLPASTKIVLRKRRAAFMRNILNKIDKKQEFFMLPYVLPAKYISANIAFVGNSKKLLRSTYGNEINSHKNIFRFNYGVTVKYEKYVGKTHDIRVGNLTCLLGTKYPGHVKGIIKNYKLYKSLNTKSFIIYYAKGKLNASSLKTIANRSKINIKNKTFHSVQWNINIFRDILTKYNMKLTKTPQCGLGTMLLVIDLGLIPDLYGYDITTSADNYGYYWSGKIVHTHLSKSHKITDEHIIIKHLKSIKQINLY